MMEELGVQYRIRIIDIIAKEHLKPEFLAINKNGKIPVLVVDEGSGKPPFMLPESGAILFFLAEKHGRFMPSSTEARYQVMQWLMFQMSGIGPMTGQFGHFLNIAPQKIPYAIDRFGRESKRLVSVMDAQLSETKFIAGEEYSIADIACYPGCRMIVERAGESVKNYRYFHRWLEEMGARSAIARAFQVNLGEVLIDRFAKMSPEERVKWLEAA